MYKKIQKKEKEHHVREIFLYDILKRWTEIQIQETVKKINDKIYSITIKKQYKYQTVRIKIKLQDCFEKSFTNGNFTVL